MQFLEIYISQGSVATCLSCGGIVDDSFVANFLQSLPVKKTLKIDLYFAGLRKLTIN